MASDEERRKQLLNALFKRKGKEFSRCFYSPDLSCAKPAIRAHSVQNSGTLDLIVSNGHVIAPTIRLDKNKGPIIDLERVGRNRATTFSGLCAEHDRELFSPIENCPVDVNNAEHRFLLAYRATYYEVHASFGSAALIQAAYKERIKLGIDSGDAPTVAATLATWRMIEAWQMWKYKLLFDQAYSERRFDLLTHDVLTAESPSSSIESSFRFNSYTS